MKKFKKRNNRSNYNGIPYTPGRNMFGEKAETHLIIQKRETALQQMLDAISQLNGGGKKEFTFDMSCFNDHPEERAEVTAKAQAFLALKASLQNRSFHSFDLNEAA